MEETKKSKTFLLPSGTIEGDRGTVLFNTAVKSANDERVKQAEKYIRERLSQIDTPEFRADLQERCHRINQQIQARYKKLTASPVQTTNTYCYNGDHKSPVRPLDGPSSAKRNDAVDSVSSRHTWLSADEMVFRTPGYIAEGSEHNDGDQDEHQRQEQEEEDRRRRDEEEEEERRRRDEEDRRRRDEEEEDHRRSEEDRRRREDEEDRRRRDEEEDDRQRRDEEADRWRNDNLGW